MLGCTGVPVATFCITCSTGAIPDPLRAAVSIEEAPCPAALTAFAAALSPATAAFNPDCVVAFNTFGANVSAAPPTAARAPVDAREEPTPISPLAIPAPP